MRKIAIFTGNRAEYGLQYSIIKAIDEHPDLEYYLLVSGAHLDEDFGKTVTEIEKDGFTVYNEIKVEMNHDSLFATAQAIGSGILSLSQVLNKLQPDILLVYADRFEGFSAVVTGTQMGIPTAHVEGGDVTEGGALDDSVRHAMTKLAHLHFTTNEDASRRVQSMGEESWRVFTVGFPAIDLITLNQYATLQQLIDQYGIDPNRPIVLFTQHSVATEFELAQAQIASSLDALEILAKEGCQIIVTHPNNDAGGKRIIDAIHRWASKDIEGVQTHSSLGRYYYHGILHYCGHGEGRGVCVGNSSSGIKETPALGCPAVNIGSRQQGRLRSTNVIDVPYDRDLIVEAVRKSLWDEEFRLQCRTCKNPYGLGNAGKKIAKILAEIPLDQNMIRKKITI